ncbi:hypothetical protein BU25DRAFT_415900 [Macroventuria anomochaeta]|uniref:Uncharacterized protein n=1 Tax=Macroventuria anomochaeta TaxID=301207 RepID=A0ACB6RK30_9PLEO|nr:uncharacterized protein BU25DRAFT_415900 [Macroventuria anomochaeta]KAF2621702.1 hypothetical protein BU25DRAFT_415900 [Macroventuria anomochaeta]
MLQNTTQNAYLDSSRSQQGAFHDSPAPQRATSPVSTCSEATIKPHQIEPPAYTNAPYLDSPPLSYHDSSPTSPNTLLPSLQQQPLTFHISTPTAYLPPPSSNRPSYSGDEDDEDVPLAQLLLYPRDAPPAYSTVVRQSYRETLLQHIPRHPGVVDLDEEAMLERMRADDVRFTVERVVAMAVVMALLVLAGLLLGLLFVRN